MSVPFWWKYSLGPSTVLYAFVLAVVAALIMGVLPGLKATGQRLSANLQELHGRTGTRLGSMWSTLIVAQVAVAVAILPAAVFSTWDVLRMEFAGRSVRGGSASSWRTWSSVTRPSARDEASGQAAAGCADVTAARGAGGHGGHVLVRAPRPRAGPADRVPPSTKIRDAGRWKSPRFRIDVDLLRVYEARLLAGRGFEARDAERHAPPS